MQRASLPELQVTVTTGGVSTVYTNLDYINGRITRNENNFDTAVLECGDYLSKNYPTKISSGSLIQVEAKDASDALWTTVFQGIILQANMDCDAQKGEVLQLHCSGAGYGFKMCPINAEYGDQSINSTLNSLQKIVTDAGAGIVPKYVNKILGGSVSSGYSYTADSTTVQDVVGDVPYIGFPYKPCHKALQDLCDLLQAIKGANAGPHWIVTTDKKLLMTTVGNHHAGAVSNGWTTYYGGSQAKATVEQGLDFIQFNFSKLMPEANHILYYGLWRRPSNGDAWTEKSASLWALYGLGGWLLQDDNTVNHVNSYCLDIFFNNGTSGGTAYINYPYAFNAAWDFTKIFSPSNVPYLEFYARKNGAINTAQVLLAVDAVNYIKYDFLSGLVAADTWYHFTLPIGPYLPSTYTPGSPVFVAGLGSFSWATVNAVEFYSVLPGSSGTGHLYIDDLHFGGASVCRVAKNSTNIAANNLRSKIITDNVGKDDSLIASDDSGVIAQMAKAELLRCQTMPIVGTVAVAFIKDLLPGQLLHVHAKKTASGSFSINEDMRVTKVEHCFNKSGFLTKVTLTDDLINANARQSFTEVNAVLKAVRPEWQDRQASSIKAGTVDITVPILEKDYPS